MFENLYASQAARTRHRAGPLAAERARYLQHCAEQGGTPASLRMRARCLLWVAERIQPDDLGGIDSARLYEIVHEGQSPATAVTLMNFARPWLKFRAAATGNSCLRRDFVFPESGFSLESAIDEIVANAMKQAGGNVSAAARLLGVSRDVV
ncbi:MAG: hypothetical protein AzoDbin1_04870, partial [Azoarcus sp.]|nr:hypothetical protein [Azoarcus sp.]